MNLFQSWRKAAFVITLATIAATTISCTNKAGASIFDSTPDDTIAPTLTTRGPMMIVEGEPHDSTFLTRGVKYSDNSGEAKLTIDASKVNWNRQGIYEVTYSVNDSAHNVTTVTEQLRVVGKNEKIVYLTFDDGPSVCTDQILNILRQERVKATFFVTAQFTPYLNRMAAIAKDGHEVAIHTYSHNFKIYKSIDSYFADLNKLNDLIEKYTGKRARIMRFPGGSSNSIYRKYNSDPKFMDRLCVALLDSGYQFVDWNLDSGDARGNNIAADRLVRSACGSRHNIQCLLMHDTGAKRTTVTALPQIIRYFKQHGYEFGVLNSVDYQCWHGGAKKKARLEALRKSGNAAPAPVKAEKPAKVEKKTVKTDSAAPVATKPATTAAPATAKSATTKTAPATKPAAHSHVESKTPAHHTPSHPKAKHDTITHQ
ncbi:MAG: polysaccharide deacetylase family protein [Bacteroidales bacterium]|nr:polysaccharide deacetylase family protein [Bacteroidales bacterium]